MRLEWRNWDGNGGHLIGAEDMGWKRRIRDGSGGHGMGA